MSESFKVVLTDADTKQASDAIDFILGTLGAKDPSSLSDYEHNLLIAVSQDSVDDRLIGILSSAIPFYLREIGKMEERKRAEALPASQHLGSVGEKITFDATLLGVFPHEGEFGCTYITKMLSGSNLLTWFASKDMTTEDPAVAVNDGLLCKGVSVRVVGTVKKHDNYQGKAQTIVTRCTVLTATAIKLAADKAAKKAAREAKKAAKESNP